MKKDRNMTLVKTSYSSDDCIFLLKDLTNVMPDTTLEEKEKLISQGVNYSEMISKESYMDEEVNALFETILEDNAKKMAYLVEITCKKVLSIFGHDIILVSLARAGTPIGILMKRYLKYIGFDVPHYSISIIRDKGIDENALQYILEHNPHKQPVFIDGWTGKGSITSELKKSIKNFNQKHMTNINSEIVVIGDPARKSNIYGTRKDICIPNACLNSTVSGLVSRTIHNANYIHKNDFHGAKYFGDLINMDYSQTFIDKIEIEYKDHELDHILTSEEVDNEYVDRVITYLEDEFGHLDRNKIKLSIGETSRAILRRAPKMILVKNISNPDLRFILHMSNKRHVPVKEFNTLDYECIALLE